MFIESVWQSRAAFRLTRRNVGSSYLVLPAVPALRARPRQGPLAKYAEGCIADCQLCALRHVGLVVRGRSSNVDDRELPPRAMAPAKNDWRDPIFWDFYEFAVARFVQVLTGSCGPHSSLVIANVRAPSHAFGSLVLDVPGHELPV